MEYRPLTDREIIERCCLNLTETYFALARTAPGFQIYEDEGVVGCTSTLDHPAANFMITARPTPRSIQKLAQLGSQKSVVAYLLPTQEAVSVREILERSNFSFLNRLNLMFYRGTERKPLVEIHTPKGYASRFECSHFLAKQFFSYADENFSRQIAGLTAESSCTLVRTPEGDAGAMIHVVSDTCGLYNIAVASDKRSRGLGGDLVETLVANAQAKGLNPVLQCHDSHTEWYERLGFRRYEEVLLFRSSG